MATINLSLPDELRKQADQLVKDGLYMSFSEVVRDALRLMFREEDRSNHMTKQERTQPK